ncbi:hypothetical protein [Streptomyces albogriseolus]|uniref:Uncharacterized protein n=1 Tax=Streptomyces albogriseolus TaxID=1887 RepID=A0ACC6UEQ8_STRAO
MTNTGHRRGRCGPCLPDSDGSGAQVIVADNSPPELIEDRVIVRYSRDESEPPYGLIDDETG